jgi:hypothetical protein
MVAAVGIVFVVREDNGLIEDMSLFYRRDFLNNEGIHRLVSHNTSAFVYGLIVLASIANAIRLSIGNCCVGYHLGDCRSGAPIENRESFLGVSHALPLVNETVGPVSYKRGYNAIRKE